MPGEAVGAGVVTAAEAVPGACKVSFFFLSRICCTAVFRASTLPLRGFSFFMAARLAWMGPRFFWIIFTMTFLRALERRISWPKVLGLKS